MCKKMKSLRLMVVVIMILSSSAWATTYYVATTGSDVTGDGSSGNPWQTITYAISQVTDGDVINVAAGTYDEAFSIQKPISLIGAGSGSTFLTTTGTGEQLIFLGSNAGIQFTQGLVIEGFTLYSSTLTGDMDLLKLRASGPSLSDPIIIRNNVFNGIDGVSMKGIETSQSCSNFIIENNELTYCKYGMWFNIAINGQIKDNTFTDAKYAALALSTSDLDKIHDIEIVGNTILRSTTWPDAGSYPEWYIYWAGMHIGSTCYNMNIHKNIIADGAFYGIVITNRGSTILTNFHINCNSIYNNGLGSLNEIAAVTIDATKNWWGSATGPTHSANPGGTGDAVSDYFTYYPWLIDTDIENCDALIAVELNSFFASVTAEDVTLTWSTATETENLGFHVYRSIVEGGEFGQLTSEMILGSGNSDEAHTYSYIDREVESGNTYYYKLADVDFNGNMTFHGPISVTVEAAKPTNYALEQSYPNPFNPETAINFSIKQTGKVSLKIYNLQGQLIRSLVDADKLAGSYSVIWNGTDDQGARVSSGTYLYTLKVNGFEASKKLVLMK